MNFLCVDCETGGLDPKTSDLLTVHFQYLNSNLEVQKELGLSLKPDRPLRAEAAALRVNGIDPVQHLQEAMFYKEGRLKFFDWLVGSPKAVAVGHNVIFDLGFIYEHFLSKEQWNQLVDYKSLCTSGIALFLQMQGKIPPFNLTLKKLAAHLGVEQPNAHTAKADTDMTIAVLKKMRDL